ncbi:hypothetical protein PP175_09375 [Aneurinibacillus sp. Ricciae_BoGa-3]|uniref:anti-sigma factor family protein n=1 Tax=Aneurinibacillus sp. Ricciae_BoGa-3 TaxID=3022697 RepID=UPI00234227CB|nr:hypothetical protein [Aneurinibacillus sp. Ricciae_BoGa-3]WCK56094.1 hypothetical protein PP175_09375 [Aneurinibacillus sp. Ricciae_BoGa-3]
MDCKTVRKLLDDPYLPEDKMVELEEHIDKCPDCKAEYSFYINFALDEQQTFLHPAHLSKEYESVSVCDSVMQRIRQENKWADPINGITVGMPRRRRITLALVTLLMLITGWVALIVQWNHSNEGALAYTNNSTTDTLLSARALKLNDTAGQSSPKKIQYGIVSSTANAALYHSEDKNNNFGVNYGLLASLFGILVTVVSISWLLRQSDNTDRSH